MKLDKKTIELVKKKMKELGDTPEFMEKVEKELETIDIDEYFKQAHKISEAEVR